MPRPNNIMIDPNVATALNAGMLEYVLYTSAGGTYKYHCYAMPGTGLTEVSWMIRRETVATSRVQILGTGAFVYLATDLATVEAYFA